MKKITIVLTAAFLFIFCAEVWGEQPTEQDIARRQYKKNLAYNKNAFPAGWQYEAGYTAWRLSRKLPVNLNTYRKYKKDRSWHNKMSLHHRPERLLLSTLDWTTEELALFLREYQDFFRLYPADVE